MKKLIISLLAILLLGVAAYTLLSKKELVSKEVGSQQAASQEFSSDFKWTQALADGYVAQESPRQLAYAGPFYAGNFDGIQENTQEYMKLRRERVQEMVGVMRESLDKLSALGEKVKAGRSIKTEYIQKIQQTKPELETALQPLNDDSDSDLLLSDLSNLLELQKSTVAMSEGAEKGFFEYMVYGEIFRLTDEMTNSIVTNSARMGALYSYAEKFEPEALKDVNQALKTQLELYGKDTDALLQELYYLNAMLFEGEKILFTSDYLYAKAAAVFIDQQLAELKPILDQYKEGEKKRGQPISQPDDSEEISGIPIAEYCTQEVSGEQRGQQTPAFLRAFIRPQSDYTHPRGIRLPNGLL